MDRPFRVVTHRNWLAQHFASYGAVQDFGFDIDPDTAEETVWWAPGAWVACAWQSGIRLPLTICGHRWMEELPMEYKQRVIVVRKLQDIEDQLQAPADEMWHVKLPEAKLDSFPAKLRYRKYLATTLKQHRVPADTLLQLSQPVDFLVEARFWIAHGKITATALYRAGERIWDAEDFDEHVKMHYVAGDGTAMRKLVLDVIDNVDCPPGFTLDVGTTTDGRTLVVEANAAWSSSPYTGDPGGIVDSIVASHDFDGKHTRWRWRPNPVFGIVQPLKWAKPVRT
jgi:hypothetical protein